MDSIRVIALGLGFLTGMHLNKTKDITFNVMLIAGFIVLPTLLNYVGVGGLPLLGTVTSIFLQLFLGGVITYNILRNTFK